LIFDTHSYSPYWIENFPLGPLSDDRAESPRHRFQTHGTHGSLKAREGSWRFEPGLGVDIEEESMLLLNCGFRFTFANGQTYDLLHLAPGLVIGKIPARARPELFAADQTVEQLGDVQILSFDQDVVGLWQKTIGETHFFVLGIQAGSAESLVARFEEFAPQAEKVETHFEPEFEKRSRWMDRLPTEFHHPRAGVAIERLLDVLEPARGPFTGLWIRDDALESIGMSMELCCAVIPALSLFRPELVPELIQTLASLPASDTGGWHAVYSIDSTPEASTSPALPTIAHHLLRLPILKGSPDLQRSLLDRCRAHIESFLPEKDALPVWPNPASAFTPEITDPTELVQFDLSALLVLEMESCASADSGSNALFRTERDQLTHRIWTGFWSEKRKRLLDKTVQEQWASRVSVATLIPLLWKVEDKEKTRHLKQCLHATDELRDFNGIRQWQPIKDDPIPPPVRMSTQHLFLPLLSTLPAESAAVLSADWHRALEQDPSFGDPSTAALFTRLIPSSLKINPNLERYPAWVRTLEKHRAALLGTAAAILLLIPAGFGIYFATRPDFNYADERLESGFAETLYTIGNFEKAEAAYTRLIELSRSESRQNLYYFQRGNVHYKTGDHQAALDDYIRAIELDPDAYLYKARWNVAQAHAQLGQMREAVAALNEFIREYGEELPAYRERAENAIALWQL
jgi:hypothetical protein